MDGDLQDPPELFGKFYSKILEGYEVVYGVRKKRKEMRLMRFSYWLYYRILNLISETTIPLDSGDFSLMTRTIVDELVRMQEHGIFIRGMRSWVGYKQVAVEYERDARAKGETKYSLKQLRTLASDGFFEFSNVPIKLMGRLGAAIMFVALLYGAYSVYERIFLGTSPSGFTALYVTIAFLAGVQLVSLRVLGEYIVRIHKASQSRPAYIVRRSFLD
jgi:dolichol-phosphate mannosyltransferase